MSSNLGIPVRLLHESLGHIVTIETKGGWSYRGQLYDGASEGPREKESARTVMRRYRMWTLFLTHP